MSDRPDTSTVRIALDLVAGAQDLTDLAGRRHVYDLTQMLLLHGRGLRPSDLQPVAWIVESVLGAVVDDEHTQAFTTYVRTVLSRGRDLRPYQVEDVLESLQERLGLEGVGSEPHPGESGRPDES